jgi:membrane-bound lytic murein transglycosylase B
MKRLLLFVTALFFAVSVSANQPFEQFVQRMETVHQFDRSEIETLLSNTAPLQDVLAMFKRPATDKSPDEFEAWFINERRINNGVTFWSEYQATLARAEKQYGVPSEIIVALLGVETSYGVNIGKHKVVESLITLGFYGHRRQEYFRSELEHFLVTARDLNWDRDEIVGSFAGAIGIPQFMPSNIKPFGVDFDNDGHIDLVSNKIDAIGSVGNYLYQAGWKRGQPVATKIQPKDRHGCAFVLRTLPGPKPTYWKCGHNYKMIKRYNPSDNYARTIFILAEKIKQRRYAQD